MRSNLHKSKVEYGSKIRFWHDLWCEDQPSKAVFPKEFSIAHNKEALVAEHVQFIDGTLQRNITFTKPMIDCEVELVSLFFNLLYSLRLRRGGEDKIGWIPSSKRQTFDVRSSSPLPLPK
jgi:hypothetical protein